MSAQLRAEPIAPSLCPTQIEEADRRAPPGSTPWSVSARAALREPLNCLSSPCGPIRPGLPQGRGKGLFAIGAGPTKFKRRGWAQSIDQLRSSFRGELIEPSDAAYDSARKLYNAMIDKQPKLVARCTDVDDIMAAVQFGRENEMLTAIEAAATTGAGSESATAAWWWTSRL